mmetsp:Transcript_8253/g.12638  ORF Transcript_8253/g.12638 Transcript_8253/m.12638 type:complete len:137 (-) Transcript_8253:756-1166(-)
MYFGLVKPRERRIQNQFELFNEFITLTISYHLIMFTDYYTDVEVRYNYVGNSMIACTAVLVLSNMYLLIKMFAAKIHSSYLYQQSKKRYFEEAKFMEDAFEEGKKLGSVYDSSLSPEEKMKADYLKALKHKKKAYE